MADDARLREIRAMADQWQRTNPHTSDPKERAINDLLASHAALAARLEAAEARASAVEGERAGLRSALEHIEVITREEMGWMYAGQRTNAAESAHKIAKCALDAYAAPRPAAEEVPE